MLTAELIITAHDGESRRVALGEKAMIGRHPECEVVLTDPQSSRRHCKIERAGETFCAEDNASANGTLLNGEPLRARTTLKSGDTIRIGSTDLVLRVVAGAKPKTFEPTMSIVRLEDEAGEEPSFHFAQNAGTGVVSEEEVASQDVTRLKQVTQRLKLLVDVGQALGSSLDPHKLLTTCLEKLFEVFPQADRGIIVLYGPDGALPTMLTPEADQNATLDRRKGPMTKVKFRNAAAAQDNEIKLSRTVINRVRTQKQSVLISDATGDAAGMSMARFEIKSLMCAPLLIGADDLGIIQLETKSRMQAFTPDDLGVMTAVAGQMAVVIRNSDLAREAALQAAHRENLSHFLSPQLVDQVLEGKLSVELGGTEKKGTIFFSDIVGFTKLASKMSPQNVVALLNRYFTVMQNIIFKRGGSIDKCAGDNIMAHWGVVGETPNFTLAAAAACVEMQIALFTFNRDEARKKEIVLPPTPLGHGIGLNTGVVCAGNIGSDRNIEFTVIGYALNLSARIEAMAGRGQTFFGEGTFAEIKDLALCVRMPDCPAKNVEKPLPVYSVRGIVPPERIETKQLQDVLFCLPCVLTAGNERVEAVVTCIRPAPSGFKLRLEVERPLPEGLDITVSWALPEKPSLPAFAAKVERCGQTGDNPGSAASTAQGRMTAILEEPIHAGGMLLVAPQLPPEIAGLGPGVLLPSDLTSHEQIIRA